MTRIHLALPQALIAMVLATSVVAASAAVASAATIAPLGFDSDDEQKPATTTQ